MFLSSKKNNEGLIFTEILNLKRRNLNEVAF